MPLVGQYIEPKEYGLLRGYRKWGIRRKLSVFIIPLVVGILLATGYLTFVVADTYLNTALDRTVQLQVMGQAHAVEESFAEARRDILTLAAGPVDHDILASFLRSRVNLERGFYTEAGFIGKSTEQDFFLVVGDGGITDVSRQEIPLIRPSPLSLAGQVRELGPGDVHLTALTRVTYLFGERQAAPFTSPAIFRLVTPLFDQKGGRRGLLILGINAIALRNLLSLYNSPQSPLHAFPRTQERRFSYYFDTQGWMLFQSENLEDENKDLSTNLARTGFEGDHSMPGLETAFRPDTKNELFWSMVVDVREGRHGIINLDMETMRPSSSPGHYSMGYAPVRFRQRQESVPQVIGGVTYMDKSRLPGTAEANHFSLMSVITLAAVLIVGVGIYVAGRLLLEPLRRLERAVLEIAESSQLTEIDLPDQDHETTTLRDVINLMIRSLLRQREELLTKDRRLQDVQLREQACLEGTVVREADGVCNDISALIGKSAAMEDLKSRIIKAAAVDADVLVIGETGTGKELAARAIHQCSSRAGAAFVSVNCGALNETLLLDELFGHVKGAFTEARGDRKGAFLAADGGTLFLDEIGNASPKVQQALLRTLETRRITPLGSDQELTVNVRLIAATNVDLRDMASRDAFREDLYYRLKVLSVETPPLRSHKDDIPLLVNCFLSEAARQMRKPGTGISRGALERLTGHNWPGNIRELRNCIIRAVAMSEGSILHREDIVFDEPSGRGDASAADPAPVAPAARPAPRAWRETAGKAGREAQEREPARSRPAAAAATPAGRPASGRATVDDGLLNDRQRRVLALADGRTELTRQGYQELAGEDVPSRTAQHDLQDLVRKGYLLKVGKGPSTRYRLGGGG